MLCAPTSMWGRALSCVVTRNCRYVIQSRLRVAGQEMLVSPVKVGPCKLRGGSAVSDSVRISVIT